MIIAVYKLGGSLLDLADLADRLFETLDRSDGSRPLLVVGGGAAADLARSWDRIHALGDERAHWLALQSMRVTQALVAALLGSAGIVADRAGAKAAWSAGRVPIVDAFEFLRLEEAAIASDSAIRANPENDSPGTRPLPHSWDATSDSIAAWIALRWPAERLVLLKSVDEPTGLRAGGWSGAEVDPWFARLAPLVGAVEWVNLRRVGGE